MAQLSLKNLMNLPELHIAIFAFLLNFIWELFQMPLFGDFSHVPYYNVILHCTRATLGDVVISLIAFWGACLLSRSRDWVITGNKFSITYFLVIGIAITLAFELLATGPLNRWHYGELMPIIPWFGIGLSPVAQWFLLPVLQLWFVKRQILGGMQ
ncbi:hypothetical protein M9194_09855 [Vibrio sp. S4M6]|uniref:hypothetical protein n=1 Tax=Vibrio sinus TaxID=2946865 RepID=UPI00202A5648|nr:hypothetical protein [Vibrio sinus]MCL9781729.1 hypothetical protein [Vibrio sinus]